MVLVWSLLRWLKRDWPSHRIWLWAFVVLTLWDPFATLFCGVLALFSGGGPAVAGEPAARSPRPGCGCNFCCCSACCPCNCCCSRGWRPWRFCSICLTLPLFCLVIIPLALIGVLVAPSPTLLAHGLLWVLRLRPGVGAVGLTRLADRLQLWWLGARLADARQRPADPVVDRDGTCREGAPWGTGGGGPAARPLACSRFLAGAGAGRGGQGLSVLVTQGIGPSCLIPGIATPGACNMADAAILPCSTGSGIRVIDTLIISHRDRDHAGNRQALLQSMAVRQSLLLPLTWLPRPAAEVSSGTGRGLDVRVLWPWQPGRGATTTVAWCSSATGVIGCC